MKEINRDNCRLLLAAFLERHELSTRVVARAIGCPEASIARILEAKSKPSDEMLKQVGLMLEIGFERYQKLTEAEKEKISEALGTIGGGTLGFASITAAISTLGTVAGLSASGIASGLAALGTIVGGGMAAGVSVAAAIPIAGAAIGYLIIKGVKYLFGKYQLSIDDIDQKWEILEYELAK